MQTVFLGDIANKITKGTTPSTYGAKFTESGVNFVKVESITAQGGFLVDKFVHIDESTHHNMLKRSIIEEGDILLTMAGAIGRVAQVPKDILPANTNQAVSIIRINHKDADSRYIRYFLESPNAKSQFFAGITQSAQPNLSLGNISKIQVPLPELDTQKKIVDILGSIDEQIELNRKMNDTIEQMGQALFRQYFINNPNAETWGYVQIGKKIKPRRGKSLQSRNMIEGTVPVISGGLQPAGYHNESNTGSPVITVSASGANAGFVALWEEPVWSADSCFIDANITNDVYFYYLIMKLRQDVIYGMQTGSGQPHIYPKHIELLEIPDAPDNIMNDFRDIVEPLFQKIHENKLSIETLTSLRDILLPRLISGKIKV
jgi:type I restriction enzyme S subunit